jgi:signal transduction histidine kinase
MPEPPKYKRLKPRLVEIYRGVKPRLLAGGLSEEQAERHMHERLLRRDREAIRTEKAVGAGVADLRARYDELQRSVVRQAEQLSAARVASATYFQRMMTAKDPNQLARLSVNHLPGDFGEFGMVLMKDEGGWVGHAAGLGPRPGLRRTVRFEMPLKMRRGFMGKSGITTLSPEDLKILHPSVRALVGAPGRVAVTRLGDQGFFVVFNPNEGINGSLLARMSRRAMGAKGKMGALEAEKRKLVAGQLAAQTLALQKMKIIGQAMGHEVTSPAFSIEAAAINALRAEPGMSEATRNSIKDMKEIATGIGRTMRLFDPSDLRSTFKPINVSDAVVRARVSRRIDDHLRARGIPQEALEMQCTPNLPQTMGRSEAVNMITQNLMRNAADAMEGSSRKKMVVSTKLMDKGGRQYVRLAVSDTGTGIPMAARPRLFQLNFTTKKHQEGVEGGMGVGMALTKQLVEDHGGEISFETSTKRGKSGTTFFVDFPVIAPEAVPPPAHGPGTPGPSPARPA